MPIWNGIGRFYHSFLFRQLFIDIHRTSICLTWILRTFIKQDHQGWILLCNCYVTSRSKYRSSYSRLDKSHLLIQMYTKYYIYTYTRSRLWLMMIVLLFVLFNLEEERGPQMICLGHSKLETCFSLVLFEKSNEACGFFNHREKKIF